MTLPLSAAPVFITNVSSVITTALEILHELDRATIPEGELREIDRAMSLLTVAQDACDWTVRDIESGPDYQFDDGDGQS